jgi:chitodextrinase
MISRLLLVCLLAILADSIHAQIPVVNTKKRTSAITINGNPNESIWEFTNNVTRPIIGTPNNVLSYAVLWDSLYLYIGIRVNDANKFNDSSNPWDDDAVEIYIDADNNGGTAYGVNDRQFVKEWNASAIWEKTNKTTGVTHAWATTSNGYTMEIRIPWSNIGITNPGVGFTIGFDVACDDDDNGASRESQLMWAGDGDNWQHPKNFGDLVLRNSSDTQAPTAPSNLNATAVTQSGLTLSWTASTDNVSVSGYDIFRNGTKINSTTVAGTSYNVTGLSAANTYQFYVQAKDASGNTSANSNTVNVTTPDTQAPTAASNLAASAITQTSLTLSWNASSDNVAVTGYDIYSDGVRLNTSLITAISFNVTGLTAATSYPFYVTARDAAGNSTNSMTVTFTTANPPDSESPGAPTNLQASNLQQSTLTLTWSASTDNIGVTGYDVYRNGIKISPANHNSTSYNVTGLAALTDYDFYVNARDAAGNISPNSNTVQVTTPAIVGCSGTGSLNYQRWNNITGTTIVSLTSNANYPNNPTTTGSLTSFEMPSNTGDNFGVRVFGYICPPATGNYTFWIASDDNSELWLSTNQDASNKTRIAYHSQWTASREWNKYPTQKSIAITLTAGQLYFIEAFAKDGTQGDNLAVGWSKPGQPTSVPSEVIPGTQLVRTIPDTDPPSVPGNLSALNISQTTFILNWVSSTDNIAVSGYDIYRNGVKINANPVSSTSYTLTGLTPGTTYSMAVLAKDAANNSSLLSPVMAVTTALADAGTEPFSQRTVIANQRMPHDLVYGPDNNLWYTERFAGTVSFVNPATGVKRVVLNLGGLMVRGGGQDGLMGRPGPLSNL